MKKDMIFFDTDGKGLTSTSANHVANLAKEMISEIETTLNEMTLYSTSVTLISGKEPNILNHGADDKEVERVHELLRLIAESKSLIARLREAREQGIELEEAPMRGHTLTEDEYFAGKSADERCRYYSLEALAATLGKAIHPGGEFADARKQLQAKAKKPHEVEGKGRDTLIYTYRPTVDQQVVEDVYFSIQARYRDVQSRLNAMKHECKKAIEESAINESTRYSRELSEWTANMQLIQARHAEHINKRSRYIASLRILIPESLRRIYDTVSQLGKNN